MPPCMHERQHTPSRLGSPTYHPRTDSDPWRRLDRRYPARCAVIQILQRSDCRSCQGHRSRDAIGRGGGRKRRKSAVIRRGCGVGPPRWRGKASLKQRHGATSHERQHPRDLRLHQLRRRAGGLRNPERLLQAAGKVIDCNLSIDPKHTAVRVWSLGGTGGRVRCLITLPTPCSWSRCLGAFST